MKNKFLIFIIIVAIVIVISTMMINNNKTVQTTSASTSLSNKKMGWGLKRSANHEQPEIGNYLKVLNNFNGYGIGNKEKKYVYLTFDEGYEAGYTEQILNILKANDVKATFFITAHYLNSQTDLVKRMIQEGHIVGNHTVNHYSMPDIDDEKIRTEITELHAAVFNKTGYEMKYLRPPKGEFSERTLDITKKLGYTTVMWSFAYDDWDENNQKGEEYAKEKIISNIHPGCIILLHGNSKDNTNVLDYCIKEIKNMGYQFKSLDEFER